MMKSAAQRNNAQIIGNGPRILVLAHGFGTNQTIWRHMTPALEVDCRLVLFDHVGAVSSNWSYYSPRRYQTMYGYAADLLELLAELELTDVIYVGHSMSAMIGLLAAVSEPARFRRMILLNGSPCYLNMEDYRGGFEQKDIDALYEAMATNYHAWVSGLAPLAVGNPERPELASEFAETLRGVRPDIGLAMARMVYQSDHREMLSKLRIPTLLLPTRDDAFVPLAVSDYMLQQIPHAECVLLETSGHLPHLSAPALVAQAIRMYLDKEREAR